MRFTGLGSGSSGNAWLVEVGTTRVLVDCGFGPREMERRLARCAIAPDQITAVLITHEHADHIGGALACHRRFGWPLHMSAGTLAAATDARSRADGTSVDAIAVTIIDPSGPFAVNDLEVLPCTVPHDAREPVQFVLGDGSRRLGILTDAGHITPHMCAIYADLDALVIECNHDETMLANGRYPASLKRRIAGGWGHLANEAAAALLRATCSTRLKHVIAAHLSEENNRPVLAQRALAGALGCAEAAIAVADQAAGLAWRDL